MLGARSTSDSPSTAPPSASLPATAPMNCGPPKPSAAYAAGPSTAAASPTRTLVPYSGGTLPPSIWLGHHFSSKIHIVRLCFLAAARQMARSSYQRGPSQSLCGRDSAVNVPLCDSAIFSMYISSRSRLSVPWSQNKGPVSRRASIGISMNCFSTAAKSGSAAPAAAHAASRTRGKRRCMTCLLQADSSGRKAAPRGGWTLQQSRGRVHSWVSVTGVLDCGMWRGDRATADRGRARC
jgi:hypothetical protein